MVTVKVFKERPQPGGPTTERGSVPRESPRGDARERRSAGSSARSLFPSDWRSYGRRVSYRGLRYWTGFTWQKSL